MAEASAFAPGHISGFFAVFDKHPDPKRRGSRGGGICVDKGARSTVTLSPDIPKISITINGEDNLAPVTRLALEKLLHGKGMGAQVDIQLDLPPGQGFGMSAAGTLSACAAAKRALEDMGIEDIPDPLVCAHAAEVTMLSGMGDAVAQNKGGLVAREREGLPPYGETKSAAGKGELVICVVGEPISTKDVLDDGAKLTDLSEIAMNMVPQFGEHLKIDILLELSRRFAEEAGLMSDEVRNALASIEGLGTGSMAMLGNAVFARGKTEQIIEALKEFGDPFVVNIDNDGARAIEEVPQEQVIEEYEEPVIEEGDISQEISPDRGAVEAVGDISAIDDTGLKIKGMEAGAVSDEIRLKRPVDEESDDLKVKASLAAPRTDDLRVKEEEHPGDVVDILGAVENAEDQAMGVMDDDSTIEEKTIQSEDDILKRLMHIPGVGKLKAKALYDAGFRSIFQIYSTSLDDLAVVPKIGKKSGEKIKAVLEREDIVALQKAEVSDFLVEEEKECPLCGTILSVYDSACYECGHGFASAQDDGSGDLNALAVYENKLREDPNDVDMLFAKGATLARLGRYKEALESYWKVEKVSPSFEGIYNAMAESYGNLGLADKAAEYYKKAMMNMLSLDDIEADLLGLGDDNEGSEDDQETEVDLDSLIGSMDEDDDSS